MHPARHLGILRAARPADAWFPRRRSPATRRVGCRSARPGVASRAVARFSIRFLGCKVSQTDAQAVRERLLADGHMESDCADVAVVNTCCVTHEAVRKSRHAVSRAARTHARVYVTGCGANLAGDAFAGMPANVRVIARRSEETPELVAGDVGAIGCGRAEAPRDRGRALREGQDGCRFSLHFAALSLRRGPFPRPA